MILISNMLVKNLNLKFHVFRRWLLLRFDDRSAQVLAHITLPVRVLVQLIAPIQWRPFGLLLEEPHGVDELQSHASSGQQCTPVPIKLKTPSSGVHKR